MEVPSLEIFNVGIAQADELVRGNSCSAAASAVQHDWSISIWRNLGDLEFKNAARNMNGSGNMASIPFVEFANVDEYRRGARVLCSAKIITRQRSNGGRWTIERVTSNNRHT